MYNLKFQIHFVHWNRTEYGSPNTAAGQGNGLAVLGIFIETSPSNEDHPELAKLIPFLEKITHCGDKLNLTETINPKNFLPKNGNGNSKRFWTYEGSLTTPPLLESVIWILFQQPIKASEKQVNIFSN